MEIIGSTINQLILHCAACYGARNILIAIRGWHRLHMLPFPFFYLHLFDFLISFLH